MRQQWQFLITSLSELDLVQLYPIHKHINSNVEADVLAQGILHAQLGRNVHVRIKIHRERHAGTSWGSSAKYSTLLIERYKFYEKMVINNRIRRYRPATTAAAWGWLLRRFDLCGRKGCFCIFFYQSNLGQTTREKFPTFRLSAFLAISDWLGRGSCSGWDVVGKGWYLFLWQKDPSVHISFPTTVQTQTHSILWSCAVFSIICNFDVTRPWRFKQYKYVRKLGVFVTIFVCASQH